MSKTWVEKRDLDKKYQVKINPKKFADIPAGTVMLVPTPKIVDDYVRSIPQGSFVDLKQIRQELSMRYHAEMTCPVVTGISIRIISEAAFEESQADQNLDSITPFWRVVNPESKLAEKLACGVDFIIKHQIQEGIEL